MDTAANPSAGGGLAPTIDFKIAGVAISCKSPKATIHIGFLHTTVGLDLKISDVSLKSTLTLPVGHDGLPTSTALSGTTVLVGHLDVTTKPYIPGVSTIINLFKTTIEREVVKVKQLSTVEQATSLVWQWFWRWGLGARVALGWGGCMGWERGEGRVATSILRAGASASHRGPRGAPAPTQGSYRASHRTSAVSALSQETLSAASQALDDLVFTNVTQALVNADKLLRPLLAPPPFYPEPPAVPKDAIDWSENGALKAVDFVLDKVVGVDGPLGINGLTHELLPGGSIPVNGSAVGLAFTKELSGLGNVSLSLTSALIGGLGSLTDLKLLTPLQAAKDAHSIGIAANMTEVTINSDFVLSFSPEGPSISAPPVSIGVHLSVKLEV